MADINMNDVQAVSEESSSLSGLVMVNDRMIGVLQLETVVGELVGDMVTE